MNSPHQREQLPDLLSDALDANERARVEAHLHECPQCARELRALQQMQATLASLPSASVPVSVRANVRAALREKPRSAFALPFAFPLQSRQFAWGGAAVVAAVGLMLLARPSLQNDDAFSRSAPLSETEMATRSASNDGATRDEQSATSSKQSAPKPAAPKKSATRSAKKPAPKPVEPSPVLPPPMAPVNTGSPRDIAPSQPEIEAAPSFNFPAPPKPIPNAGVKTSQPRPVAPADLPRGKSALPTKSAPQKSGAPSALKSKPQTAAKVARNLASKAQTEAANEPASDKQLSAPLGALSAPSAANMDQNASAAKRDQNSLADAPQGMAGRLRMNRAGKILALPAIGGNATSPNWTGGQIEATIAPSAEAKRDMRTRAGGQNDAMRAAKPAREPLMLTFSVANPIGSARLILLAPDDELTIWRGTLNASPAQVELAPEVLDKLNWPADQPLRARLEQIDGDGNLTSSATFDVPVDK